MFQRPSSFFQDGEGNLLPVLKSSLISLENRERPATSLVRFQIADEGLLTMVKFRRLLQELEPTLCAIRNFEMIYGSNSDLKFEEVGHEFWRRFNRHSRESAASSTKNLYGNPYPSARQQAPFSGTITTILFRYAYPPLQRNEPRGSKQGSMPEQPRLPF